MQELTTGEYFLNVTGENHSDFLFKSNVFLNSYRQNTSRNTTFLELVVAGIVTGSETSVVKLLLN